jgi:hypothetical protein
MTPIHLRVRYKRDTGKHPLLDSNYVGRHVSRFKPEYILWLEELLSNNPNDIRTEYKHETGWIPITDMGKGKYKYSYRYGEWLEDKYILKQRKWI